VPWNNNNAEHAIKRFANYRNLADGRYAEKGLNDDLALLSLSINCKFRRTNFLRFLLSKEMALDAFSQSKPRCLVSTEPEVYADAELPRRPVGRRRLTVRSRGNRRRPLYLR